MEKRIEWKKQASFIVCLLMKTKNRLLKFSSYLPLLISFHCIRTIIRPFYTLLHEWCSFFFAYLHYTEKNMFVSNLTPFSFFLFFSIFGQSTLDFVTCLCYITESRLHITFQGKERDYFWCEEREKIFKATKWCRKCDFDEC
jgi:hypothetical protein